MAAEAGPKRPPLGLIAGNPNFPGGWEQMVAKVKLADELGYDSVWMGETWGYDLVARLTELVLATKRIKVGAGIFNTFSRSPGTLASGPSPAPSMPFANRWKGANTALRCAAGMPGPLSVTRQQTPCGEPPADTPMRVAP